MKGVIIAIVVIVVLSIIFVPQCGEDEPADYSPENSDNSESIIDNGGNNSGYHFDYGGEEEQGDVDDENGDTPCTEHTPNENCICTNCGATVHALNDKCTCTRCGLSFHVQGSDCLCVTCGSVMHDPNASGYCRKCGFKRDGDTVSFGSYPQERVVTAAIVSALNEAAGSLPNADITAGWTSYGYYANGTNEVDFMWYKDVQLGADKYRGVYFTTFRDDVTTSAGYYQLQDDNGYSTGVVYWFRYAPIEWTVLSEEDGKALILCNMVIDAREYAISDANYVYSHNGGVGYPNNYALSDIRKWLNDDFYNTAFAALQKNLVLLTEVDNSARSTNMDDNDYACVDTEDYVFLLSEQEVTNDDYSVTRTKKSTDYAEAQGAYTNVDGAATWWLRSPWNNKATYAFYVDEEGNAYKEYYVYYTYFGAVPAIWLRA